MSQSGTEASAQQITHAIDDMHTAIIGSWSHEEMRFSPQAHAQTTLKWTATMQPDCDLTVASTYPGYRSLDEPFMASIKGYGGYRNFPLSVSLLDADPESFNLVVSPDERDVKLTEDNDSGELRADGLLRMMGVSSPKEVLDYIRDTSAAEQAKIQAEREIIYPSPAGNRWPYLRATNKAIGASILQKHAKIYKLRTYENPTRYHFEGSLEVQENGLQQVTYTYDDSREADRHTPSPERLLRLKKVVEATLDIVYGQACFRYDYFKNKGKVENVATRVAGLDGQLSEYATKGYQYGFVTRPAYFGLP